MFPFNEELLVLISEHLHSLKTLIHWCTATGIKPSSKALTLALNNAIPSWVNIPANLPPHVYIDIAKWFFDPKPLGIKARTTLYKILEKPFFLPDTQPSTHAFWIQLGPQFFTKRGRTLVKELLLEWRAVYTTHLYPSGRAFPEFIDHLVCMLDHAFVLQEHNTLTPTARLSTEHWGVLWGI
jgi:hypothetical protein